MHFMYFALSSGTALVPLISDVEAGVDRRASPGPLEGKTGLGQGRNATGDEPRPEDTPQDRSPGAGPARVEDEPHPDREGCR
jgi:hypothetical protein